MDIEAVSLTAFVSGLVGAIVSGLVAALKSQGKKALQIANSIAQAISRH